jgi:peroxiredoxin
LPSTIEQVYQDFKDRGLTLYAINIEESRTKVTPYVQKHKMTMPVLLDPDGTASAAYHITATPTVFLIGRDGKFVAKAIGTKTWSSAQGRALLQRLITK